MQQRGGIVGVLIATAGALGVPANAQPQNVAATDTDTTPAAPPAAMET